ncbi:MAG: DUF1003 domain-containing protein [Propionibacteriaceae bacterium]|nr:DUF1003 domain-containing protein [Micropruina sp.]HBX80922.1 DUF1003 domain-containing protein [Propionibacteriaceae bacterium]HBY22575.1 DUF1003 domain-containing protein [Propionibacteriaceae bacterium]
MADNGGRLNTPGRRPQFLPKFEDDFFGRFSEAFARYMGTAKFLLWMTILIVAWVLWNAYAPNPWAPDRFPFLFLTLALSLQASYAAPLILLAQNRQEARDRVNLERDRRIAAQSKADMDFLAREIASLRMRMNDVATRDFIRSELRDLLSDLEESRDAERRETERRQGEHASSAAH